MSRSVLQQRVPLCCRVCPNHIAVHIQFWMVTSRTYMFWFTGILCGVIKSCNISSLSSGSKFIQIAYHGFAQGANHYGIKTLHRLSSQNHRNHGVASVTQQLKTKHQQWTACHGSTKIATCISTMMTGDECGQLTTVLMNTCSLNCGEPE